MASCIGSLRSNDPFVWIKTTLSIFIHRNAIVLDRKALAKDADIGQPVCLMTLFNEVCLMMLPWCWQGFFNSKQPCFDG